MTKKALVFLAPGAEEMEFVISVDVLRRGGMSVVVAGLPDFNLIKCSRNVNIKPDIGISEASSQGPYDVLVLPGGLGGAKAFTESQLVGELLKEQEKAGKWIAAICAAPTALKAHGVGVGKAVTSYPAMKAQMEGGSYNYKEDKVVVDGNLITSRGPGTAFDFALTIVDKIVGQEKAIEVAKGMLLCYPGV
ncbi:protein dj-1beta isoform X2 [Euwallacea similis]